MIRARARILFVTVLLSSSLSIAQDVRIGVLGLFHPHEFTLAATAGSPVIVSTGDQTFVLEKSSVTSEVHVRVVGESMILDTGARVIKARILTITGRDHGPAEFVLSIPGKITRRYHGTLELRPSAGSLLAVVNMDLETAVASVVAAESLPDTPIEALKAQAVAVRSYFVAAKSRHHNFDFCDTTHCQFLRDPPSPGTPAARAATATRGLVIAYNAQPVPAMYTRSCSGRTTTPAAVGLPATTYPYFSVDCKHCRRHPARWHSQVAIDDAERLQASNESARLDLDRRLGWNTVPSNSFTMRQAGEEVVLQGAGQGHGIGLCQAGATAMAAEGATFTQILAHYYPNTILASLDRLGASNSPVNPIAPKRP
jgi:peptidoglycan hydrolase-like amidase